MARINKSIETESTFVVARDWEKVTENCLMGGVLL
jgi:hypothetical protein